MTGASWRRVPCSAVTVTGTSVTTVTPALAPPNEWRSSAAARRKRNDGASVPCRRSMRTTLSTPTTIAAP